MLLERQIYHPSPLIDAGCIVLTAATVGMLVAYVVIMDMRLQKLSALFGDFSEQAQQ